MSTLTFGIIKPDAVAAGNSGKIIDRILQAGFKVRGLKLIHQSKKQAEGFYAVHAGKGFYEELTDFMPAKKLIDHIRKGVADFTERKFLDDDGTLFIVKAT